MHVWTFTRATLDAWGKEGRQKEQSFFWTLAVPQASRELITEYITAFTQGLRHKENLVVASIVPRSYWLLQSLQGVGCKLVETETEGSASSNTDQGRCLPSASWRGVTRIDTYVTEAVPGCYDFGYNLL